MEGKYLDPKADVTFKKIFGEHEDLMMSLLNALLPLEEGKQIEHVEYLQTEMVPENPGKKNSIVDVRCRETGGRHFIVEMQMNWNNEFQQRVILIECLPFVFVELPKFKPQTIKERKMAVLWLRFLTEINRGTVVVPAELLENPETSKALQILEKSAYTEEQLYAYERYWDYVNYERGIVKGGYVKGLEKGRAEGRAEGITSVARNLKSLGVAIEDITKATGLSADEIAEL